MILLKLSEYNILVLRSFKGDLIMYKPKGKDYFKNTSKVIGLLYVALGITLVYCLGVLFLPPFATWCWGVINGSIEILSMGNETLKLFMQGFFWSCTGILVLVGVALKIIDYINLNKKDNVDTSEEIYPY